MMRGGPHIYMANECGSLADRLFINYLGPFMTGMDEPFRCFVTVTLALGDTSNSSLGREGDLLAD